MSDLRNRLYQKTRQIVEAKPSYDKIKIGMNQATVDVQTESMKGAAKVEYSLAENLDEEESEAPRDVDVSVEKKKKKEDRCQCVPCNYTRQNIVRLDSSGDTALTPTTAPPPTSPSSPYLNNHRCETHYVQTILCQCGTAVAEMEPVPEALRNSGGHPGGEDK
ncbi:hypothetical protein RRG08_061291 [Elysia crispata]|uniref:Uncharacterized protein n=1 Tax=Elysia crispata TaxID=231223 RepID=A0AAE0YF26_9GAST|nr:hypothetical protein RRG08_061291 [Elysia crispata]